MSKKPRNKLLEHRTTTALSQDEMAFLLGVSTGSRVSRYESRRRIPRIELALAYVAIHQKPLHQLLDGSYIEAARAVHARAMQLHASLTEQGIDGRKVERLRTLILVLETGLKRIHD